MPPTTTKVESHDNENTEILREGGGVVDSDEPVVKRQRRASEVDEFSVQSALPLQQHRALSPPITSGALHLEIHRPTESSGPLEPSPTVPVKRGRKKTMTPVAPKRESPDSPSTLKSNASESSMTSGPLTLAQVTPAPATPIRPLKKKISAEPLVVSPTVSESVKLEEEELLCPKDEIDEDITNPQVEEFASAESSSGKDSVNGSRAATSGSTTPMTTGNDEEETADPDEQQSESQTTSRGNGSARGKKRRGGRGGSYSTKPVKVARKKEENAEDQEQDDEQPGLNSIMTTPTTSTASTRADSFQTQKNRLSKLYDSKELNEQEDLRLLDLQDYDELVRSAPEADTNLMLEERTNELRDIHAQAKFDLQQLERRWRQQNEAKRK